MAARVAVVEGAPAAAAGSSRPPAARKVGFHPRRGGKRGDEAAKKIEEEAEEGTEAGGNAVVVEEEDDDDDGLDGRVVTLSEPSTGRAPVPLADDPSLFVAPVRRLSPEVLAAARAAAPRVLEELQNRALGGPAKPLVPERDLGTPASAGVFGVLRALRLGDVADRGQRAFAALSEAWERPREGLPAELAKSISLVAAASLVAGAAAAVVLAVKKGYI